MGEALGKYDEALKYAPNWTQRKDPREVLVAAYRGRSLAAKADVVPTQHWSKQRMDELEKPRNFIAQSDASAQRVSATLHVRYAVCEIRTMESQPRLCRQARSKTGINRR